MREQKIKGLSFEYRRILCIILSFVILIFVNAHELQHNQARQANPHFMHIRSLDSVMLNELHSIDIHNSAAGVYDLMYSKDKPLDRVYIAYFVSGMDTVIFSKDTILSKTGNNKYNALISTAGFMPDSLSLEQFTSSPYFPHYLYIMNNASIPYEEMSELIIMQITPFTELINTFIKTHTLSPANRSMAIWSAIIGNGGLVGGIVNHFSQLLCCYAALPPVGCIVSLAFPVIMILPSAASIIYKGSVEYAEASHDSKTFFIEHAKGFMKQLSDIACMSDITLRNQAYELLRKELIRKRQHYYEY